ncbi:SOS response-associated peptidase, partial [Acinetobacter baumannii]|nr:SOS response-associated peptidase [Acinetobacter baumannii]
FFLDMEPDEYLAQPKEELKKFRSNA